MLSIRDRHYGPGPIRWAAVPYRWMVCRDRRQSRRSDGLPRSSERAIRLADAFRSTFCDRLTKVLTMGSVHKFQRPPKNEQQFKGYRPVPPNGLRTGKSARWQLRNWQKSSIAWSALMLLAVGVWGIGKIL